MGFGDTAWGLRFCVPALGAPLRRIWVALARTDADSAGRPKMRGARGGAGAPTLSWKENVASCEGRLLGKRRKAAPARTTGGSGPFRFPHLEGKLGHCKLKKKKKKGKEKKMSILKLRFFGLNIKKPHLQKILLYMGI